MTFLQLTIRKLATRTASLFAAPSMHMGSRPSRGQSSGANPEEDGVEGSAGRSCRVQTGGRNPLSLNREGNRRRRNVVHRRKLFLEQT